MEVASLAFQIVTTVCIIYISFVALQHSARPRLSCEMLSADHAPCDTDFVVTFAMANRGHWYAKPMAINTTVFLNFDSAITIFEARYGASLSYVYDKVRPTQKGMNYVKAKGLKLGAHKSSERVQVSLRTPSVPGEYPIVVDAYSENGASITARFTMTCSISAAVRKT